MPAFRSPLYYGLSNASIYKWREKFAGMEGASDPRMMVALLLHDYRIGVAFD